MACKSYNRVPLEPAAWNVPLEQWNSLNYIGGFVMPNIVCSFRESKPEVPAVATVSKVEE